MKRYTVSLLVVVALVCGGFGALQVCWAQKAEHVEKMQSALPEAARVQPKAPRKLLVFNLCKGFAHSSIPIAAKTFEMMGQKTGAFEAVSSEDIAMFEPGNLAQFDAVVMNNATGDLFKDADADRQAALNKSLLDFVKGGKGLIGVHAATDCFYNWPEFGEMMGGYFDGHPWHEKVAIKLDDPDNPICAAFEGKPFEIVDEIYQIKDPYSRKNLRILLSLDIEKTNMDKGGAVHRKDGDFGVSWVRNYGKGRVFYCSLGHREEIFWNPVILQHYLDGIQFALGDLPADATPSDAVDTAAVDAALKALPAYEFGQSREGLTVIADAVRDSQHDPEYRKALVDKLTAILKSDATRDAKDFVCRQLAIAGTEEAVPVLAGMLTADETCDMARYALERMAYAPVDQALLDALGKTTGKAKAGVVNSLGERRCPAAVAAVAPLVADADAMIAGAAMAALGKIGGPEAIKALADAKAKVPAEAHRAWADAYLVCADSLCVAGQKDKAVALYEELSDAAEPAQVRVAAFVGKATALGESGSHFVAEALAGEDMDLVAAAAMCVRQIAGQPATEVFVSPLQKMQPAGQVMLLTALADRGDAAALPAVMQATASGDASVRLAAIDAVAKLGDASAISPLVNIATTGEKAERDVARNSLGLLRGPGVDAAMLALAKTSEPPVRAELIRSLAARQAVSAVPDLLNMAQDPDEGVRVESYKALAELATPDQLPALVDLIEKVEGDKARKEAERAVVGVAKKIADGDQRAAAVLAKLPKVDGTPAKCSMVRVLGEIGDNTALDPLRKAAKAGNNEVQDTAVRALAGWPNGAVLDDLVDIAGRTKDDTHRVLALRGLLRLLEQPEGRSLDEVVGYFETAMAGAKTPDEKKMVLGGLANVKSRAALKIVEPCLDDEALKEEATLAANKIKAILYKATASSNEADAKNALDGNKDSRWGTGAPQKGGEWFQLDLGAECEVRKVTLDAAGSAEDYPRGYQVFVSNDTENWGDAVAEGQGSGAVTDVVLAVKSGRYVRIVQTGADETHWWSIGELTVDSREK